MVRRKPWSAATESTVGVAAGGRHVVGGTRPSMHRRKDEQGEKEEARAGAFSPGKDSGGV